MDRPGEAEVPDRLEVRHQRQLEAVAPIIGHQRDGVVEQDSLRVAGEDREDSHPKQVVADLFEDRRIASSPHDGRVNLIGPFAVDQLSLDQLVVLDIHREPADRCAVRQVENKRPLLLPAVGIEERLVDLHEGDRRMQHDVDVIPSHLQPDGAVRLRVLRHELPHSLSGPDARGGSNAVGPRLGIGLTRRLALFSRAMIDIGGRRGELPHIPVVVSQPGLASHHVDHRRSLIGGHIHFRIIPAGDDVVLRHDSPVVGHLRQHQSQTTPQQHDPFRGEIKLQFRVGSDKQRSARKFDPARSRRRRSPLAGNRQDIGRRNDLPIGAFTVTNGQMSTAAARSNNILGESRSRQQQDRRNQDSQPKHRHGLSPSNGARHESKDNVTIHADHRRCDW